MSPGKTTLHTAGLRESISFVNTLERLDTHITPAAPAVVAQYYKHQSTAPLIHRLPIKRDERPVSVFIELTAQGDMAASAAPSPDYSANGAYSSNLLYLAADGEAQIAIPIPVLLYSKQRTPMFLPINRPSSGKLVLVAGQPEVNTLRGVRLRSVKHYRRLRVCA